MHMVQTTIEKSGQSQKVVLSGVDSGNGNDQCCKLEANWFFSPKPNHSQAYKRVQHGDLRQHIPRLRLQEIGFIAQFSASFAGLKNLASM